MSVAVSRRPSIVPVLGTAVPTFARTGTATRVNGSGKIESVLANVPRFDYNPVTLALKGLLIEEARTNSVLRSEEFDHSDWAKINTTVAANTATDPMGTSTADVITVTANAGEVRQNVTGLTAGAVYAFSIFLKAGTIDQLNLLAQTTVNAQAAVNLSTATITPSGAAAIAAYMENHGNGWYRCVLLYTIAGTSELVTVYEGGPGSTGTYSIWGAQLENVSSSANGMGRVASSYIPTTSAAVARVADSCKVTGISSFFNAAEGTLLVEWSRERDDSAGAQSPGVGSFTDGAGGANRLSLYLATSNESMGYIVFVGGSSPAGTAHGTYTYGSVGRHAHAWKVNDFAFSANGNAVATDTSGAVPAVTQLDIGDQFDGAHKLGGHVRKIKYWNKRLTNAQLETLSAGGETAETPTLAFDFTAEDVAAWGHAYA